MEKVSRSNVRHGFSASFVGVAVTLGYFVFLTVSLAKVSAKRMSDPDCGRAKPSPRIVMGKPISRTRLPWIVYMESTRYENAMTSTKHVCGGSLIAHNYVVTAAHCVVDSKGTKSDRVDVYYNTTRPRQGPVVRAAEIIPHPDYNDDTLENDIALLKLQESLYIDEFVMPVCLPEEEWHLEGKSVILAGWGYIAENKTTISNQLLHIKRKILPYVRCNETFVEKWQATLFNESVILCTSSKDKDTCQGDSGGPVTMWRQGLGYQVGVVSFGLGCARPNETSLHTNLHFYLPWIASEMASHKGEHIVDPTDATA